MSYKGKVLSATLLSCSMLLLTAASAFGQVSPDEILNPKLKAAEQQYFEQIQSLHRSIGTAKFAFPFRQARYLNAKPGQRAALDSNGIEFVYFQHRVVLKISGIYSAAFNAAQLSENERASRAFQGAAVPILQLVAQQFPEDSEFDGVGFEIEYDTRDASRIYDYEGREVITVVLNRGDAFAYAHASEESERQRILNRSEVFVNGKDYGLALGQREPFNVEALERSNPQQAAEEHSSSSSSTAHAVLVSMPAAFSAAPVAAAVPVSSSVPTTTDARELHAQLQMELASITTEEGERFHLLESAAPAIESEGDQRRLHFTMRNTLSFDRSTTSIYKRAAQSFDLFLAPELRDLLRKLPANSEYNALEFSVLNQFGAENPSPESIDYICPLSAVHSFVANKITSQDLISQSIVLVNGVRIAVNLQLVE